MSEAIATILAALIAVSGSIYIFRKQRHSPERQRRGADLWQRQAQTLLDRVNAQTDRTITYLEAQCEDKDRQIAEKDEIIAALRKQPSRRGGSHD